MKITLPFPPSVLRPNDKTYWRIKSPIKVAYRELCKDLSSKYTLTHIGGNIPLSLTFYPPNNRWDWDGMVAAFKSGQDGMCLGLGINDKLFRPITIDFGDADKNNSRVEIEIK